MYYVARGSIPRQRHTQHRAADGSLYAEELFGVEGFTGRSSLLYHLTPPTRTHRIEPVARISLEAADDGLHRHRLTKTAAIEPSGDVVSGRIPLYFNRDVVFGIVRPAGPMPDGQFYRNGDRGRDAVHPRGDGRLRHDLRPAPLRAGRLSRAADRHDLAARSGPRQRAAHPLPRGALGDRAAEALPQRLRPSRTSTLHTASATSMPPSSGRPARTRASSSSTSDRPTGSRPTTTATIRSTSSAGTVTCGRSASTSPTSSRSPAGSTSRRPSTRRSRPGNFVVCSFVPLELRLPPARHPGAVQPLEHQQRRGHLLRGRQFHEPARRRSAFTVHPAGIPHGPHPGTAEASIGKERTEELAVMVDTFNPLAITRRAAEADDPAYPYSWLPPEDEGEEASELAERGPEAFPIEVGGADRPRDWHPEASGSQRTRTRLVPCSHAGGAPSRHRPVR